MAVSLLAPEPPSFDPEEVVDAMSPEAVEEGSDISLELVAFPPPFSSSFLVGISKRPNQLRDVKKLASDSYNPLIWIFYLWYVTVKGKGGGG